MGQRALHELSEADCKALLATCRVGRIVYVDEMGPVAIPVNYGLDGVDVVFRVEPGSKVAFLEEPIAFEVDRVDEEDCSGWSVLVRGSGSIIPIENVSDLLKRVHTSFPKPWARGVHNIWVRIAPHTITGRLLGDSGDSTTSM